MIMKTAQAESEEQQAVASADVFMSTWKVSSPYGAGRRESTHEVELIASHTSDLSHLEPSCPDCQRLRSQLESMARTAVKRVASTRTAETTFEIFSDPACIVCSPAYGCRPSVTVSIYLCDRSELNTPNGAIPTVNQLQQDLAALGVRNR
jgi:hypothetical protein